MIQFNFNNQVYNISKKSLLRHLLIREDLLQLPLTAWNSLLIQLTGMCFGSSLLRVAKACIEYNDKSSKVNSFTHKDKEYWFDKNTRASLLALVSCSENTITLVLGDELIELEVSKAKKFLQDLEIYASKCFINTQKHLKAIKELKTVEDIINYDYTKGYPDKLKFDEYLDLA